MEILVLDVSSTDPPRSLVKLPIGGGILGAAWSADGSSILAGIEEPKSDIVLLFAD